MAEQVLMQAKGTNGTVQLLSDRVRIIRPALLSGVYYHQREAEIPLEFLKDSEFKQVVGGLGGYLTFHDTEGKEQYVDYCVSFLKPQEPCFAAIHKAIEDQLEAYREKHILPRIKLLSTEELV